MTREILNLNLVLAINNAGESEAHIDANKVYIGNEKSTTVIAGKCSLSDVTATYIAGKIATVSQLTVQSIAASGTISAGTLNGDTINLRQSAGAGYVYTNIKGAAMSSLTLTDNGNGTYTLTSYKIDGTPTTVGTFSHAASATHTVTSFDTNAIAGESSDGYTNNNQFFSISGSGSTAEVVIVVTGTWYCDGVSRSANRYIKRAPTNVYKRGWNDCRSRAMTGTPMYDGAGNAYYRLPSAI